MSTVTDEQLDQIEQALVKAALGGSAPAAKWLLRCRRPEEWMDDPEEYLRGSKIVNNLFDMLVAASGSSVSTGDDPELFSESHFVKNGIPLPEAPRGSGMPEAEWNEWSEGCKEVVYYE